MQKKRCDRCGEEFFYSEDDDIRDNDLIQIDIRKVVIDENGNTCPLFSIPPDKRRLVGDKFIKMICHNCLPLKQKIGD